MSVWRDEYKCGQRDCSVGGEMGDVKRNRLGVILCVWRERCSLGLSGRVYVLCRDLCMCVCRDWCA